MLQEWLVIPRHWEGDRNTTIGRGHASRGSERVTGTLSQRARLTDKAVANQGAARAWSSASWRDLGVGTQPYQLSDNQLGTRHSIAPGTLYGGDSVPRIPHKFRISRPPSLVSNSFRLRPNCVFFVICYCGRLSLAVRFEL